MATCKTLCSLFALVLALSAVALLAAEGFHVDPADTYAAKQSQAGVTLAVKTYHTEALAKEAFGKGEPHKYGILPVLVVITNGGEAPIKLDKMHARFVPASSREGIESITAQDLFFFNPKGHAPKQRRIPGIGSMGPKVKKGPLSQQEFSGREFSVPVLPPGETAGGFFYFDVGLEGDPLAGASIYVAGLDNMSTGQELFYFEVPIGSSD
jgi:hypothetical protein